MANVLLLLSGNNQGGYDVVCKVQIEGSIASQTPLSWWGKHQRRIISQKHVSNI
jgi:hypothetical protein